jgi:hypothetical protein
MWWIGAKGCSGSRSECGGRCCSGSTENVEAMVATADPIFSYTRKSSDADHNRISLPCVGAIGRPMIVMDDDSLLTVAKFY